MTIDTCFNHTELSELELGHLFVNLLDDINDTTELRKIDTKYAVLNSTRYQFEFFYGNPDWMEKRQQNRLDLLVKCHQEFSNFDYRLVDRLVNTNELADSINNKPADESLRLFFEHFQGIAISESHREPNTKKFLCNHMKTLADLNINTIYIEHIPLYMQKYLDEYFSSADTDGIPPRLEKFLKVNDDRNGALQIHQNGNLFDLVTHAKKAKIRVVGIDDNVLSRASAAEGAEGASLRDMTVNHIGQTTIKNDPSRPGKFIILAGGAHCQTHRGLTNGVPGFSQLFCIPSIQIQEDDTVSIVHEDKAKRCAFT